MAGLCRIDSLNLTMKRDLSILSRRLMIGSSLLPLDNGLGLKKSSLVQTSIENSFLTQAISISLMGISPLEISLFQVPPGLIGSQVFLIGNNRVGIQNTGSTGR